MRLVIWDAIDPLWRHRNEGRTQIWSSFHEWCCHYNSNAMVNWLYCNSIVGNHIDAKLRWKNRSWNDFSKSETGIVSLWHDAMNLERNTITMTSQWAPWRLSSPTTWRFIQWYTLTNIKETSKLRVTCPLWGEFTGDRRNTGTKGQ